MVFKISIHEWTTNNAIQTCINDHVLFNMAAAIKKILKVYIIHYGIL